MDICFAKLRNIKEYMAWQRKGQPKGTPSELIYYTRRCPSNPDLDRKLLKSSSYRGEGMEEWLDYIINNFPCVKNKSIDSAFKYGVIVDMNYDWLLVVNCLISLRGGYEASPQAHNFKKMLDNGVPKKLAFLMALRTSITGGTFSYDMPHAAFSDHYLKNIVFRLSHFFVPNKNRETLVQKGKYGAIQRGNSPHKQTVQEQNIENIIERLEQDHGLTREDME